MAGIYLHVPFCKQACTYCDFHFSTSLKTKDALVSALIREIELRHRSLTERVESLYFGGGTPSLLSQIEIQAILDSISANFEVAPDFEFTFEANPDDLSPKKCSELKSAGINRLSIGIQSFDENYLQWMNRAHNAEEALRCVGNAVEAGIANISIDLIYGLPQLSLEAWEETIDRAVNLGVQHISAYCLTIEPQTVLGAGLRKGKVKPVDEDAAALQFEALVKRLVLHGFEQYEVSNFALAGWHSRHNTSYWKGTPYLGIGPSAHSFNGKSRMWNVSNNIRYIQSIEKDILPLTCEELSKNERYNEAMMTSLRTKWGVNTREIKERFQIDLARDYSALIAGLVAENKAVIEGEYLKLTPNGLFLADGIASDFFILDP